VVGELIGAAIGKAELTEQLIESYKRKEIMVRETSHAFRNRITAIGGFSRRLMKLTKGKDLIKEAKNIYREVQMLETHLERFEKYIGI
jgi:signal transduction histidine kinase